MSISKVRLPNNTEEDIKAKYLIQSTSSDVVSEEFVSKTVTEDAIANIQKIYGNTVVESSNLNSNSATAILSRGFNQWDEEWELGTYSSTTGGKTTNTNAIRSKNLIPVSPGTTYYLRTSTASRVFYYNASKVFQNTEAVQNATFTIPSNCCYLTFHKSATTSYGNDVCVNISDTSKNGTYEPYNGHQIDLGIPTITGKLNGTGSSVVIFPDGMKKSGMMYDEIVGSKATVRIQQYTFNGTEDWKRAANGLYYLTAIQGLNDGTQQPESNYYTGDVGASGFPASDKHIKLLNGSFGLAIHEDTCTTADSFKQYLVSLNSSNAPLVVVIPIATPQEYILDNPLQLQYPVVAGGTEMVLPTTGTAPMKMDVIYGNAADATSNLSSNFISVDSMKAFLNNLGTQMGGTWNMQYNNGKFEFTFSSS